MCLSVALVCLGWGGILAGAPEEKLRTLRGTERGTDPAQEGKVRRILPRLRALPGLLTQTERPLPEETGGAPHDENGAGVLLPVDERRRCCPLPTRSCTRWPGSFWNSKKAEAVRGTPRLNKGRFGGGRYSASGAVPRRTGRDRLKLSAGQRRLLRSQGSLLPRSPQSNRCGPWIRRRRAISASS